MVGVEQPQLHARRSMDGGLRVVDAKLVGVMATADTLRATVGAGHTMLCCDVPGIILQRQERRFLS